jgi:hypothetical protein
VVVVIHHGFGRDRGLRRGRPIDDLAAAFEVDQCIIQRYPRGYDRSLGRNLVR